MDQYTSDLRVYFNLGLAYKDILECLARLNRAVISMSTLKRQLRDLGLYRRKHHSDLLDVATFIMLNLQGSEKNHGYSRPREVQ